MGTPGWAIFKKNFFKLKYSWSSHRGAVEMNLTRNHEVAGSIPDLAQWVKDLALLWLWRSPASVAPIRALAWESPYAAGAALNKTKQKKSVVDLQYSVNFCYTAK